MSYPYMMHSWLHDKESIYVLAAYGVAAAGLLGLLIASLWQWRSRRMSLEKARRQG